MIRKRPKKRRPIDLFKPNYQKERDDREREDAATRAVVREKRWELDGHRCIWPTCRIFLTLKAAHIHEVIFRSQGGDPNDLDNTVTVCSRCHDHLHRRIGGVLKEIVKGDDGERHFYERETGSSPWKEVQAWKS